MSEIKIDLGVQYGGSSMKIAYVQDDTRSIIVNEDGYRYTPSVMAINDTEFSVGLPAKQNMIRNAQNTILHAKHYMSNDLAQVHEIVSRKNTCEVKMNENNELLFSVEKGEGPYDVSLSEAVERQLQFLVDLAKSSLKVKETNTVLAVPCYFTEAESNFLKSCAENAGFHVLRVIRNPVAACLAYDQDDITETKTSLVYQLGGNSVEVSLVTLNNGLYRILDSRHLKNVGGDKFTDLIVEILVDEFKRKNRCDPKENKRSVSKLKSSAEDLKHILSTMERAHCTIDALYDGIDFDYYLNRQRFETGCGKLFEQVLAPIDELLAANGLEASRINQVILAGAATKMCKLQSLIMQKFENSKFLNTDPDEIIALGCARECNFISNSKHTKDLISTDLTFKCTSEPIFLVNGSCPDYVKICTANTPFPLRRNYELTIDPKNPVLKLQESDDKVLAKINLSEFKTKAITFGFNIKIDGLVEVSVTEKSSNKKLTAVLNQNSINAN